jgi:hypothetical protein
MPVRLSATAPASLHGCGGPWRNVSRRAPNLVEDILSTYYKCTVSAITHILCFQTYVSMDLFSLLLVRGAYAQNLSAPFSYTLYIRTSCQHPCGTQNQEWLCRWGLSAIHTTQPRTSPPPWYTDLQDGNCSVCRNIAKPTTFCMAYSWNLKSYIVCVCACARVCVFTRSTWIVTVLFCLKWKLINTLKVDQNGTDQYLLYEPPSHIKFSNPFFSIYDVFYTWDFPSKSSLTYCHVFGVPWIIIMGSGLYDWIYWHLTHTTHTYNQ